MGTSFHVSTGMCTDGKASMFIRYLFLHIFLDSDGILLLDYLNNHHQSHSKASV
jgi:hypothetical protein